MNGKKRCELLKSIRCKIAKENGLRYTLSECTFQGKCKGTCPKCEAELRQLTNDLEKLRQGGKRVAIAGIAAAMVATSAAGCTPKDPPNNEHWEVEGKDFTLGFIPETELTGDIAYEEEVDLSADGEFPESSTEGKIALEEEPEEEYLTGDIVLSPEEDTQ